MINNTDHSSAHITLKINIPDKGIYEVRLLLHLCFCTKSMERRSRDLANLILTWLHCT